MVRPALPTLASTATPLLARALACVFLLASLPAVAGWVVVSDQLEFVAYADDQSLTRNGDVVRLRDLVDLKVPRRSPYGVAHLSSHGHSEFDCRTPRMRTLSFAMHAGQMGRGEVVEEIAPSGGWTPVFDGTLLSALRKYACG